MRFYINDIVEVKDYSNKGLVGVLLDNVSTWQSEACIRVKLDMGAGFVDINVRVDDITKLKKIKKTKISETYHKKDYIELDDDYILIKELTNDEN